MKNNARDLAIELENVIYKIAASFDDSMNELQRLDLMQQDVLHHMENNIFNASEGYKYAKALQVISKERRLVKQEKATLQCLNDRIKPFQKDLLKSTKKAVSTYTRQDELITLGNEAYRPRVLRSLDKNDVLNQVIEILNGEE